MKVNRTISALILGLSLFAVIEAQSQETVFGLLKKDLQRADEYVKQKNFRAALTLYSNYLRNHKVENNVRVKIARCYFSLKQYGEAVRNFESVEDQLQPADLHAYGEALSINKEYDKAISIYKKYLTKVPDDQLIIKKIWRLTNIQFLLEDSMHYAVRPVKLNTEYGELCPVPYENGTVFISNRMEVKAVHNIDAALQTPFYRLYFSMILPDTANAGNVNFGKAVPFGKELASKFHTGPVAFYNNFHNMVFASSGEEIGTNGERTLQLFFAERSPEGWKVTKPFPFNASGYSISDPAINQDGNILFFSSDMKGGYGGKDLYRSEFINGQWTKPVNLGEHINTTQDEAYPYLHQNRTLYFSSNGHPGFGGLDIFKAEINAEEFDEAHNMGYPINSSFDEFGITIDSLNTHGYFSSNRNNGGYNDDVYEFDMDLQTYPMTITGLVKFKEHNWTDSSELKILPHARLFLIDNLRNVVVHEGTTDSDGNFSITVPYFTKYRIRIVGPSQDEHVVSLDIPKHRRSDVVHEIVIVKDVFRSSENP